MSKSLLVSLLLLSIIIISGFSGSTVRGADIHQDTYSELTWYLICELNKDQSISVLSHMKVMMAAPLEPYSDTKVFDATQAPNRNSQPLLAQLTDQAGNVIFQKIEHLSGQIRGEFHGENFGDPIDGHFFEAEHVIFVVRVPVIKNTKLRLQKLDSKVETKIDLEEMVLTVSEIIAQPEGRLSAVGVTGNPANRVDILYMGDGYTIEQEELFLSNVNLINDGFFNITPLAEYRNYYNVNSLFIASNESGADHPPYDPNCSGNDNPLCCRDAAMQDDDYRGQMVDTAFDGRFCGYHTHRLVMVNQAETFRVAGIYYPDWDNIIMILNDPVYGGSGGDKISVITMNDRGVSVAQHEFGHSFGDLADEYEGYFGYPPCSDKGGLSPCEANVTDVNDRGQIKWRYWIESSTPIPTPPQNQGPEFVGLFEGARYRPTGMYRSGRRCLMNYLDFPFCPVPSQAIVLRQYQGGWGIPENGIRQIEPDSTLPDEGTINLNHPATQTFSFELLQPVGGASASIQWYDGLTPIVGETGTTFRFETSELEPGAHYIRVVVKDPTDLVKPEMEGDAMITSHSWLVNVTVNVLPTPTAPPVVVYEMYLPIIYNAD